MTNLIAKIPNNTMAKVRTLWVFTLWFFRSAHNIFVTTCAVVGIFSIFGLYFNGQPFAINLSTLNSVGVMVGVAWVIYFGFREAINPENSFILHLSRIWSGKQKFHFTYWANDDVAAEVNKCITETIGASPR